MTSREKQSHGRRQAERFFGSGDSFGGRLTLMALDGETEAHGLEDGGGAGELRIALLGEREVELSGIEVGLASDRGDATVSGAYYFSYAHWRS